MSRYHGNGQACPHCGLTYGRFRTGFSYYSVFEYLKDYSDDSSEWRYKRRATVLGAWHQIKREMWFAHVEMGGCEKDPRNLEALSEVQESAEAS